MSGPAQRLIRDTRCRSVDGEPAWLLAEDVDGLMSTRPMRWVRLLPAFDQYVLAPGTADIRMVPPHRRALVSRQAGWISPIVVADGQVAGTWELDREAVSVSWFGERGGPPAQRLEAEVARLAGILGRDLQLRLAQV